MSLNVYLHMYTFVRMLAIPARVLTYSFFNSFFYFLFFYFLGRAGAKGLAVSFFTDKASKMAAELVVILREANQEIPSQLESMRSFGGGGGGRYGGR